MTFQAIDQSNMIAQHIQKINIQQQPQQQQSNSQQQQQPQRPLPAVSPPQQHQPSASTSQQQPQSTVTSGLVQTVQGSSQQHFDQHRSMPLVSTLINQATTSQQGQQAPLAASTVVLSQQQQQPQAQQQSQQQQQQQAGQQQVKQQASNVQILNNSVQAASDYSAQMVTSPSILAQSNMPSLVQQGLPANTSPPTNI
jgi:hypothetical protein